MPTDAIVPLRGILESDRKSVPLDRCIKIEEL